MPIFNPDVVKVASNYETSKSVTLPFLNSPIPQSNSSNVVLHRIQDKLSKKKNKKKLTPLQQSLIELQEIAKNFGIKCSKKEIKKVITEVFLVRFPNGTALLGDKMTSAKKIKNSKVVDLNDAIKEWIKLDGYDRIKEYF
jgi:hypothetical protein